MPKQIELVFGMETSFHLSPLCYKEIRVTPKIRIHPSGTLSQSVDIENFAGKSIVLSTKLVDAQAR